MSEVPAELKYTKSHEWVRRNEDGSLTVGITDHAQGLMGDMVYVELPDKGTELEAGGDCAVVESVKAASDVYAPVSGEVLEVNETITDSPETVNKDAYGEGWMFRVQPGDESQWDNLMDASDYEALVQEETA